ncbi:hypothetical protein B0H67DRAFT_640516 [Lasiosphaeris hirsuta]|uniref:LYR motif-containing protein Cup1-like N-terminal domain-containing protein n=1 Tax=Lasiosphaeris hirsuta TaxID=260670 RepID=A0AA40BDL5_9PEZI|nr:hypothetical protein B0H67DRAFT_640516 [Lasiosphaeris hirsuta]
MSRPLRIAEPTRTLHIYRHLLRESSYLPVFARSFFDSRIKDRFRRNEKDWKNVDIEKKKARHGLRYLRAANNGDRPRMRRLLLMALGRIGRRRRELLDNLIHSDAPKDGDALEAYRQKAEDRIANPRKRDFLDGWDLEKIRAFAKSQARANLRNPPRTSIAMKQLDIEETLPKENIWGMPPAKKLLRSKERKAWMELVDRIQPPLPTNEWEAIRDLVHGKLKDPAIDNPLRRPVAKNLYSRWKPTNPWNWHLYATQPVAAVDRQASRLFKLLSGRVDDNTPTGDPNAIGSRELVPRSWRRLLGQVWSLTAKMEKKASGEGWDITWGGKEFKPPVISANSEFFENIQTEGDMVGYPPGVEPGKWVEHGKLQKRGRRRGK